MGYLIGLPQSTWLCGKRSKRGHPQFAKQILMTSGLRRANVASRWTPEFTKEVGALKGTLFFSHTQVKRAIFAKKIESISLVQNS